MSLIDNNILIFFGRKQPILATFYGTTGVGKLHDRSYHKGAKYSMWLLFSPIKATSQSSNQFPNRQHQTCSNIYQLYMLGDASELRLKALYWLTTRHTYLVTNAQSQTVSIHQPVR